MFRPLGGLVAAWARPIAPPAPGEVEDDDVAVEVGLGRFDERPEREVGAAADGHGNDEVDRPFWQRVILWRRACACGGSERQRAASSPSRR